MRSTCKRVGKDSVRGASDGRLLVSGNCALDDHTVDIQVSGLTASAAMSPAQLRCDRAHRRAADRANGGGRGTIWAVCAG